MPIDVSWGNTHKTYVYIHVSGKWNWQEYHSSISEANQLINTIDHKVCIITHLTDSEAQLLPKNAFLQWQKSTKEIPSNLQSLILVPGRPIIQIFMDTAYRMFGRFITFKFMMASTLEDAQILVQDILEKSSNTENSVTIS